ncbi:hypothetical protein AB4Y85_16230 [Microvirga sp. 2YAF29]|uniref:hypothetical protein n=1 Tax=Microvirga sp. 2YAF29 TaxID=3233031 RepID=UPI003F9654AF
MTALLSDLRTEVGSLSDQTATLLKGIPALPESVRETAISNSLSVDESILRLTKFESLAKALLNESDEKFNLVPLTRIAQLRDRVKTLGTHVVQVNSLLNQLTQASGYARYDASNFHVYAINGTAFDFHNPIRNLNSLTEQSLDSYFDVAPITRPRATLSFGAASKVLKDSATEATEIAHQLDSVLTNAKKELGQAKIYTESANSGAEEISRILGEIEKSRRTTEENEQKAIAAATKINNIVSDATSLESQITEYESDFNAFQAALDQREKNFREGSEALATLRAELSAKDAEIEGLMSKAKEMLGGATTAGLSHAYKSHFEDIDLQLKAAKRGFHGAVFFLFISVLAAVNLNQIADLIHSFAKSSNQSNISQATSATTTEKASGRDAISLPAASSANSANRPSTSNLLPTTSAAPQPRADAGAEETNKFKAEAGPQKDTAFNNIIDASTGTAAIQAFTNMASRFLVILPGLLLIGFAAKRHSALFRLREQYSHKWAIAASVEGFKTQAPAYQEQIAAAVFTELLTNPGHTSTQDSSTKNNGFLDRLIKPAVERTLAKMGAIEDK